MFRSRNPCLLSRLRARIHGYRPVLAVSGCLAIPLLLTGCGDGSDGGNGAPSSATASPAAAGGLSQEEMEKGIGPVTHVELGEIDPARVTRGGEVFDLKCAACHKLEERYIGPPLGDVLDRRTPEFVMNMMLNSWEMTQKHPTVKEMLGEYYTPMPDQGLTEEDARALLDYLRKAGKEGSGQ